MFFPLFSEFRTLIIEMVIATDMSTHFQQIKTLKTLLSHQEFSVDKQKGLSYILHTADISHPSKVFNLHQRWTLKLMEEFFLQVCLLFFTFFFLNNRYMYVCILNFEWIEDCFKSSDIGGIFHSYLHGNTHSYIMIRVWQIHFNRFNCKM